MGRIYGYMRLYTRWNGESGLTIDAQKQSIERIVGALGFDGRRRYFTELPEGADQGWPVLRQAIGLARDDDFDPVVVIPTLDGVRFNASFLDVLSPPEGIPVVVCSAKSTTREYREMRNCWHLVYGDQLASFHDLVAKIRRRQRALSKAIRASLRVAAKRGEATGARRRDAHQFTALEQSKGGRVTASRRRCEANEHYRPWIPEMCQRYRAQQSMAQIARWLNSKNVRTPAGKKIHAMLVWRILHRDMALRGHEAVLA